MSLSLFAKDPVTKKIHIYLLKQQEHHRYGCVYSFHAILLNTCTLTACINKLVPPWQQTNKLVVIYALYILRKIESMLYKRAFLPSFLEMSVVILNPGVPRGWNRNPEESEDHQNVNPGVSNVEISRGTAGFGVFEEPLGIPTWYGAYHLGFLLSH